MASGNRAAVNLTPATGRAPAAPSSVLVNKTGGAASVRRMQPDAMEHVKESLQAEPVWFDIHWIDGLDLPMPDEADRPQQGKVPPPDSLFSIDDTDVDPYELQQQQQQQQLAMLVQRLDLSASPQGPSSLPSVLAPPAAPAASIAGAAAASSSASANVTSAAAPDAAAPNIGAETAAQEDVEFGSVPASIHRSHFHQNKASATAPSVDSADNLDKLTQQQASKLTIQRCVAAQRYFIDFYYHHFLYLSRREERLLQLRSYCDSNNFPENIREKLMESFRKRETNMLRLKRKQIKVSQFQILWQIGRGAYGQVFLATKKDTHEVCAIKRMRKMFLLSSDKTDNVMTERDILSAADSEWLVKLLYSFQDNDYLYLAMEYVPGGDLRSLLTDFGVLSEDHASFYMAEMIVAVSTLHSIGYYHRDIKPENWLIDATGHLKLTDFGLSKSGMIKKFIQQWSAKTVGFTVERNRSIAEMKDRHWKRQQAREKNGRSYSRVGSPDYMAPELLSDSGYNQMVDYWALGCILYEMLAGVAPFSGLTAEEVFRNILEFRTTLTRPMFEEDEDGNETTVSDESWDLITKLLTDQDSRLGKTQDAFRAHPLLKGYDFDNLRSLKDLPFIPNLKHSLDTTYFSAVKPEDVPLDPPDMTDNNAADNAQPEPALSDNAQPETPPVHKKKKDKGNKTPMSSLRVNTITGSMLKGFTFEHHGPREQLLQHFTEAELLSPSVRNIVDSFIASNQEARDKKAQNSIVNAFDPPSFSSTASSTSSDSNL